MTNNNLTDDDISGVRPRQPKSGRNQGQQRECLHSASWSLEAIRALDWRSFEALSGEMFRRLGYWASETGEGPDDGIDLLLKRGRRTWVVQCKRWRSRQIGIGEVRELLGVVTARQAEGGFFVASGRYTRPAWIFGRRNGLELIDGRRLLHLVSDLEVPLYQRDGPRCPRCGAAMAIRSVREGERAGQEFWGCARYPVCRGSRTL